MSLRRGAEVGGVLDFPWKKWIYFSMGKESLVLKAMAQKMNFSVKDRRKKELLICRVPIGIIGGNENSLRPIVLAVGPYHHGNENLRRIEACKAELIEK